MEVGLCTVGRGCGPRDRHNWRFASRIMGSIKDVCAKKSGLQLRGFSKRRLTPCGLAGGRRATLISRIWRRGNGAMGERESASTAVGRLWQNWCAGLLRTIKRRRRRHQGGPASLPRQILRSASKTAAALLMACSISHDQPVQCCDSIKQKKAEKAEGKEKSWI